MKQEHENNMIGMMAIILSVLFFLSLAKCQARDWTRVTAAIAQVESKNNPPIDNVEAVIYTNDANPTQWRDEGSELAKMRETVEWFRERLDEERTLKNSYNRSFFQACRVIDLVKYQLDKKESARTWDGIEDCIAEVEKIFEELHQERKKITDRRLAF